MKFYLNGVVGAQTLNSKEFQTDLGLNKSFIARRPMGKAFRKAHSGGHQDHSGPSHILSSILVEMEPRIPHRQHAATWERENQTPNIHIGDLVLITEEISRASDLEDGKGRSVDLVKEEAEGGVLIPFRDHRGSVVDAMKERIIRVRSRRGTARGRRDEGDVERERREVQLSSKRWNKRLCLV